MLNAAAVRAAAFLLCAERVRELEGETPFHSESSPKGLRGVASQHLKLMSEKRQKNQLLLTFLEEDRGGARTAFEKGPNRSRRRAG